MTIRKLPPIVLDALHNTQNADIVLDPQAFGDKVWFWDGFFDDGSGKLLGFSTKEAFLNRIVGTQAGVEFIVQMRTSTFAPEGGVEVMFMTEQTSASPQEKDIASFIFPYAVEEYIVKGEIPTISQKLIFATKEDIRGKTNEELKEVEFFIIELTEPFKNQNSAIKYSKMRLKQIVSYKSTKNTTGTPNEIDYIIFNFTTLPQQPINAKYLELDFKSKPVLWGIEILGESATPQPLTITKETHSQWYLHQMPWINNNNSVSFLPIYSNELKYHKDKFEIERPTYHDGGGALGRNKRTGGITNEDGSITFISTNALRHYEGFPYTRYKAGGVALVFDSWKAGEIAGLNGEAQEYLLSGGYSVFQLNGPADTDGSINGGTLPRPSASPAPLWKAKVSTAQYLIDGSWANFSPVGSDETLYYYTGPQRNDRVFVNVENKYTPYLVSDQWRKDKSSLLTRSLVWNGIAYDKKPPARLTNSIDLPANQNPSEWETTQLNATLGLYPQDPNNLEDIIGEPAPGTTTTSTISVGFPSFGSTNIRYLIDQVYNGMRFPNNIFFNNENGSYKIRVEVPNEMVVNQLSLIYFGGYEYTMTWFDKEGKLAEGIDIDGKKAPILPEERRAQNRKGDPLNTTETRSYGSTLSVGVREARKQISKYNEKVSDNKKININTGKKIKKNKK